MDSFEFNKIAGAVLGTTLGVMGLGIISEIIYEGTEAEEPAYVIAVAAVDEGHGAEAAEEAVETVASLAVLLQSADVDRGQTNAKKCVACHSFDQGGAAKVGPNLWDVVGRDMAAVEGFGYSDALVEMGQSWTFENLDKFLESPKSAIKGTAMSFVGLKKPDQRADVIAYLRSLSDSPVPLPDTVGAETEAAESATAEDGADAPTNEEEPPTSHN